MTKEEIKEYIESLGLSCWEDHDYLVIGGVCAPLSGKGDACRDILRSIIDIVDIYNTALDRANGNKCFSVSCNYIEGYMRGYEDAKKNNPPRFNENYHKEWQPLSLEKE